MRLEITMAKQINPQGYNYGKDPTNTNPFWSESEIAEKLTASASVDDTTGTPKVSVSTTGYNVDFKFSGLKGERGEKGEQGIQGEQGKQGEQGIQGRPGISGTDGKNGYNVTMDSTGSKQSGTISTVLYGYTIENGEYKSQTSYVYNGEKGERGAKGEQGEQGVAGKDGKDADMSECVTDVSITNENGVYGIKQTKGTGTGALTTDAGSIEVPNTDNLLAEVTDSVTEDTVNGFDYHVVKETENNGVQNDVGSFYIARKQITSLNEDGTFTTVDQSGVKGNGKISVSGGGGIDSYKNLDVNSIPISSFTPVTNSLYLANVTVILSFNGSSNTSYFVYPILFRTGGSNEVITGSQNDRFSLDSILNWCACRLIVNGIANTEMYCSLFLYYDSSKFQSVKVNQSSISIVRIGGLAD